MATFSTFHYSVPEPANDQYFKPEGGEYKGFKFTKLVDHMLFKLLPVEGKILPASLSGMFSKVSLVQAAIDDWLTTHPGGTAELPDISTPPRSHHKKVETEIK
jgi:hypothetical protein